MQDQIDNLNQRFGTATPQDLLTFLAGEYPGRVAFSTSLGAEDQVITDIIGRLNLPVRIFTLDTGRLFQETYDLIDITSKKYGIPIEIIFPEAGAVEQMVRKDGINLFYDSVENRQRCCRIRKIEPLKRALEGMSVWITGMRKEQSVTRTLTPLAEYDPAYRLIKVNPLIYWTMDEVWAYLRKNHVPVSDLHAKGYPSIGCLPCTRPVGPGEDLRSGRWWWELPEFRECGLHKKS